MEILGRVFHGASLNLIGVANEGGIEMETVLRVEVGHSSHSPLCGCGARIWIQYVGLAVGIIHIDREVDLYLLASTRDDHMFGHRVAKFRISEHSRVPLSRLRMKLMTTLKLMTATDPKYQRRRSFERSHPIEVESDEEAQHCRSNLM